MQVVTRDYKYCSDMENKHKTFKWSFGNHDRDGNIMIIIFWEMTPCGSYKNRRFGGSYRLRLQGARVRAGY
jgi:hypothetical protein